MIMERFQDQKWKKRRHLEIMNSECELRAQEDAICIYLGIYIYNDIMTCFMEIIVHISNWTN